MTKKVASVEQLKAKLAQLDALVAEGVLRGEEALRARADLEAQVLRAVVGQPPAGAAAAAAAPASAPAEPNGEAPVKPPRRLVAGVALFVLVVAAAGYAWLGNRAGWKVSPGESGEEVAQVQQQAQIDAMVAKLEARLKTQTEDAEGWAMLSRSYGVMGRYADAVQAQKRVVSLRPQDAQALADLADATAMANGRQLEGEPERLIEQALKLDARNVKALALAGTVAFNHNDFKRAAQLWEQAMAAAEPGSATAQQLAGALDEARQKAGLPPLPGMAASGAGAQAAAPAAAPAAPAATPATASPAAAAASSAIRGRVSLRADLKGKVGPDDTVFVFARPANGSRMPLAIVRRKAGELPFDFTLDDSLAMSPAAKLSQAQQVIVGARISKTGNAMPSPGDLQVLSAPMPSQASGVKLEIGEPLP